MWGWDGGRVWGCEMGNKRVEYGGVGLNKVGGFWLVLSVERVKV